MNESEIQIDDSNSQFETFAAVHNNLPGRVHHDRVSVQFNDGEPFAVQIQPFRNKSTPDGDMGSKLSPDELDEVITALERIKLEYFDQ